MLDLEILSTIYNKYIQSGDALIFDEVTRESEKKLREFIDSNFGNDFSMHDDATAICVNYASRSEEVGFYQGFKYAFQLAKEIF